MARLNATWFNFAKRGQVWDHFWQDAAASTSTIVEADAASAGTSTVTADAAAVSAGIAASDGIATDAVLGVAIWDSEASSAGAATALADTDGGAAVVEEAAPVGGGIPRRHRRRYIMPDDTVVYATTAEVLALLKLYAVPLPVVSVEKQRSVQITMPQIVLEKRDVRFIPATDSAPDTWQAVISERFTYQPPPEVTRQAEIRANRMRADEEALVALLM